jgi:hypothetical protein
MGKLDGKTPKKREEDMLKVRKGGIGAKPRVSSDAATCASRPRNPKPMSGRRVPRGRRDCGGDRISCIDWIRLLSTATLAPHSKSRFAANAMPGRRRLWGPLLRRVALSECGRCC